MGLRPASGRPLSSTSEHNSASFAVASLPLTTVGDKLRRACTRFARADTQTVVRVLGCFSWKVSPSARALRIVSEITTSAILAVTDGYNLAEKYAYYT